MIWNVLLLALRTIRRNVLRSALTILGIVIGVAAVITMVTLGNGATKAVTDQIASIGSNLVIIIPGQRFGPASSGAANFNHGDVEAIRTQIPAAQWVAPLALKGITAIYQSSNWSTVVYGTNNDYFRATNWTLAAGRDFNEAEQRFGKVVCVIGETVRAHLFGNQNPIGSRLRLQQFSCDVIGVLKAKGQSAMGSDQDDNIVMPLRTVQRRLTGNQDISRLLVAVKPEASLEAVKDQLTLLMRERRRIDPTEEDDFRVMDTRQIAEALTSTTRILTLLLGAVAAVSLLVGGIGIMNIMLVSVTERTHEIGIRLAVGALERDVLLQFLIEAIVLSSLGGLIGLGLATGTSMLLARLMDIPYVFGPGISLLAFLFSAVIGIVFGFFPALRAARLNPIDALRHE